MVAMCLGTLVSSLSLPFVTSRKRNEVLPVSAFLASCSVLTCSVEARNSPSLSALFVSCSSSSGGVSLVSTTASFFQFSFAGMKPGTTFVELVLHKIKLCPSSSEDICSWYL